MSIFEVNIPLSIVFNLKTDKMKVSPTDIKSSFEDQYGSDVQIPLSMIDFYSSDISAVLLYSDYD
jgi:hypothetical protein